MVAAMSVLALCASATATAADDDDDDDGARAQWWYGAKLSVDPGTVSENGGNQTVTVTAEVSEWGTSTSDISYDVTVGKGGDSAASGTDYHAVAKFKISIKSGRRSGSNSFSLEPIGDADWEGDETITIHASGPDGAQSTTLTLTDEADRPYAGPQVTLAANPAKMSEADGATTVTVTAASAAHSVARKVSVSVGGSGTATAGTDYAAVSDVTITLAKNATSATGTFTLTPTQDKLAEGDETIALAGNVEGVSAKLTGTNLTLTDDDAAPAVTLSASPSSVTENGGAQTVTVTATSAAAVAKARTVLVAVGNRQDTATPATDYTVVPAFNITIAANATTATGSFSLTPTNDTSVENAESISIDGTPESGGAAFTVGGTTIALTDDDAQPAVTLAATPSSVAEAALATSVTVKATAASTVAWARTVTVSVGKTGSAASGTDYAAVSNFDIAIAANALSGTGTFSLKPTQDTTNEGDETIGVAGSSLNTTVTGATVTINDDDINPAVTLSVSPASVLESASATTVTVTATGASAMTAARTVAVKVGGGTATSGTDYAAVSDFNITIAANATSGTGTFTLTPTQDTTVEGGETIGVDGSSTGTTVTGTTVALTDDDGYPAITLSVSTSSVSEGASATSVTVTATAASSISSARTVTVSVGQTGTATPGADYAAVTDFTITIAANATSGMGAFTLTPTQDAVFEHDETIGVDGSSPNTIMTNATITLTDDDKESVTLTLNRNVLGEEASGTSVTVTATAATAIAAARTVTVSVGDTGTATSGTDYAAVSDFTITIAANATSGTGSFTLTPTQDTTNEGNETIGIAGSNSLSIVTGAMLTLVDDDQETISLSSTKTGISESWSGSVDVTATRPSATTSAVDVTVVVGAPTDTATEGVDYQEVPDFTITILANQTSASKSFTLSGIRDAVGDNNERLSISGLATGYKVSGVANGILIFEWYSTIELKADVSSVSEHDGATTVTVTALIHPTVYGNVPVDVSIGGGTATSGTDYAAVSNFRINIPNKASSATGTFTLTPTQDSLLESDETISINGHGAHFNAYGGRGTSMTLTDAQPIALSATPSTVSEGAAGTQVAVSATATGTVSTPRTVTVSVGDTGTATSGTDYAAVSDFDITIPANKTGATNTFTLTPTKDSASEGDETIGVSGASTVAYVSGTTLTLADTNPAVTLTASPSSISEGASATSVTVTATAAAALASARTVTVSVGDTGTATSGTDYAAVSDFTITIAANKTSGTGSFTLTPTDDTALEGDETIGMSGTSSEAATISGTALTLTDDDLPTIALATVPADLKIAEGAGLKSVTVRATAAAAMKAKTTLTLAIGAGGDSATKTTDYTTSNVRTITIPKGQSMAEASFELTPVQDTTVEGDETVSVSGSSSGGHAVTGTSLTLTDDDKHAIALSASPSSVGEGASATSVTVTATAKSAISSARTVTVKVGGSGTATSGTDYATVSDFTVAIAANAKSGTGTFTLTPTQDTSVEGSETIGVAGTASLATVTGTTVTLTDDDSYPAITLSANPSSVSEGASATSVTVTATAASAISSARTVTVSVGGSGTASSGADYATVADFTVTIAANGTSGTGTFTLTPTQDTSVEGSETIGVAGTSPSSTVTGTTATLTDDDTHAITLAASPSSVSESKASETITVTATLNAARTSATTVTVSVGESGDQATAGTDYKAVSDFTVTIAANATSGTGTFTFEPKTDAAYEGFESVTISGTTAAQPGGGANAMTAGTSIPVTDTSLAIHDASNYPAITLTAAPSSVAEGAAATSVTVTATAASAIGSSREVTVSVGGSGTATSGTDYAAVSDFIVKIAANASSGTGTFTLTPTDDSVVEASETIGVAGTSLSTTVTGTTLTLTDNDSAEVTVNDANAAEGSSMTFTVTLDTAVQGGLTVTPDFTDVTAVEGADYDENTAALSFTGTAGETQTFTVSATQDAVVEGDETFTVGLTVSNAPTGVTVAATDTGTGTINAGTGGDQDTATLTISDASADEGDSMTFTVTLSEAVQGGLTVTPNYANGTAASGDYTANTMALTFTGTKGETKTFTVPTVEDAVLEADETFTVGMTVSGTTLAASITSTDTGTGTIDNDDSAALTVNDASASEGSSMTFTVTLSEAVQGGLTATPDFTDSTATEGTDYDENTTPLSFSGTKGETATFTVSTHQDAVLEADETFTVDLAVSGTTLTVTATDTGTGTINDDDSAVVTVGDADADEGDGMAFTVTLSEAVQGGLVVTPSYTNGTAASTDYTANTTALTFTGTKGETETFTVSTTEDAALEADETFTVDLAVSGTTLSLTATDTGTGTINNDDSAAVTVNDADADEGDGITFTVTLGAAVQGGLTVTPGYTNGTAAAGDYSKNSNALTFAGTADETKTFTVSTTEDAVLEADETFTVDLAVSGTSLGVTASDTGTGTVNNDDSAAVTVSDANADEGNSMTFTVTLGAAVQGGLKVTPDFTDVTAVEGTDYDENTTTLSFAGTANEAKTFTVSTTEDAVVEGNETFTVGLTVSGTALGVAAADTGTGTVNNDDGAVVTVNNSSASEGDALTFTVTLGAEVQGGLTVTPSFTDVTALEATDYDENTAALSFTGKANETKTFTVATTEDAVLEADETFIVGLGTSNSGVTATDTGTGTIANDDSAAVTVNDASADEGDGMTFTVTLDSAVQGGLEVTPSYADGTASSGDYTRNTTALSFSGTVGETKTFTVSTTEDAVLEANETFAVGIAVSGTSLGLDATDTGAGTINNDDGATVTVGDASADEGDGMTFTVTLGEAVQGGLTVTPDYTNGTAASTDYTANTAALSFAGTKGETKTFTVPTTEDNVFEADETFTVGLSASNSGVTSTDTGIGTIANDDGAPAVDLSLRPSSLAEGASATLVTVTAAFSNSTVYETGQTVTVAVGGGTATSGTDYAAVADFDVTIAAGQGSATATFALAPTQDTLVEGSETIGVSGSAAALTVHAAYLTLTDDDGAPAVHLSLSPSSVGEGDGATQVTVTAAFSNASTYGSDTTVSVGVGAPGDSAVEGADYAAVADFDLTIAAGAGRGSAQFTLVPTSDTLAEGDESLTVGGAVAGLAVNGASLVLFDDDGAPSVILSAAPSSVAESAGATAVTVTATFSNDTTYAVDTAVRVGVGGADDSATAGADYAAVADFTVTIPASGGSGSAAFTLTPTRDSLVEGRETIAVGGASPGLQVHGTQIALTDDDEAPTIRLSVDPPRIAEGAGGTPATLTARFSNDSSYAVDTTVVVTVGEASDSATAGVDYASVEPFEVTIAAGRRSGSAPFTLAPVQDALVEGAESIGFEGSSRLAAVGADMTLTDDDAAPAVALSLSPPRLAEGAGETPVEVTAAFTNDSVYAVDTTVTVTVGDPSDSAAAGADYAVPADFEVTIPAGQTSGVASFTLAPMQDTLLEADERITVSGASTLPVSGTAATLADDDEVPGIELSVAPGSVAEGAGSRALAVTATFTNATTFLTDTTLTVSVGADGDTAAAGTDYAPVADFELTIEAGASAGAATFALAPTQDTLIEDDETITVSGAAAGIAVGAATVALADDDGLPTVHLSAAPGRVAEGDGPTTVTVAATFSNGSTFTADTRVAVTVGAADDSAVSGADYSPVPSFDVVVPAGATSGQATFALAPTQDTLVEGGETITLDGAAAGLAVTGAGVALADDDGLPAVALSASLSSLAESAGESAVTVTAAFSKESTFAVDTRVMVTVGAADDSAVAGADYAPVPSFEVTVPAGATTGRETFALRPTQDTLVEGEERIALDGATPGLAVTGAEIALTDDDALPTVRLSLSASPLRVGEGAGESPVTVAVTAAFSNDSTFAADTRVMVTVGAADDSAVAGADYAPVSSFEVTIPAGATAGEATFALKPVQDTLVEGEERVALTGAAPGLTVTGAEIVLVDDDAAPTVRLSASPSSVGEGAGESAVTVTAAFSNDSTFARDTTVSVTVGGPDDGAVAGADYAPVAAFEVTVPAGATAGLATFALKPTQDTLVEGEERIALTGAVPGLNVTGAEIALTDDDAVPTVRLSASPSSVGEGAGESAVTVTAAFSNASTFARDTTVAVTVGAADDSAVSGADYAPVPSFEISVPAGETTGTATFALAPIQDTLVEGDEGVAIGGAADGLTVFGAGLVLTDDDAVPTVRLSASPSLIGEGAGVSAVTVTAAFSNESTFAAATGVAVTVGAADDSAVSGADYAPVPSFEISVPAGETTGTATFALAPIQDTLVEGDEGVAIGGAATGLTIFGAGLVLTDDDAAPTVQLAVSPSSVAEDAGATALTVTATFVGSGTYAADTPVTVSVGDAGDSAVAGTDYAAVADFEVTVPAGAGTGSAAFTLAPVQDALFEADETIALAGSASGLDVQGASATLTDDDRAREPVRFSVADAAAKEGEPLAFAVRLSRTPAGRSVAVRYRTEDRTAAAGEDYVAMSGTLTFAPGETAATVAVRTLDDAFDEGVETLALVLGEPVDAEIEDGEGIGALGGEDPLAPAWIARFGRTASSHVMEAVDGRLRGGSDAPPGLSLGGVSPPVPPTMPPGSEVAAAGGHLAGGPMPGAAAWEGSMAAGPTVAGSMFPAAGSSATLPGAFAASAGAPAAVGQPVGEGRAGADRSTMLRDLLGRSSFRWSPGSGEEEEAEERRRWTFWGRGAKTRFDGREGAVALAGDVVGATLGVDAERNRWTAGLALALNEGRGTYSDAASGDAGDLRSRLTSIHPYVRWAGEELSIWGVLGHGRGDYAVRSNRAGRAVRSDLQMSMAGLGARRGLATAERLRGIELALRADATLVWMRAEGVEGHLRETRTRTGHARVYLEGARSYRVGQSGHLLTPSLELGVRGDAGDAETGAGLEVAGRLRYENPARNLRAELRGQRLLGHRDDALAIWGAGGEVVYDAGTDGLGLSFSIKPTWGTSQGGVADLWGQAGMAAGPRVGHGEPTGRLDTEVGYGLAVRGGASTLRLLGASGVGQDGTRSFRLGTTLVSGERSELSLFGERKTLATGELDSGVLIRARRDW